MPVYFVRQGVTGNVKIGVATDVAKRLPSLQTAQPIKLRLMRVLSGTLADERMLHRRFAECAIGGEWFRYHHDMMGDR